MTDHNEKSADDIFPRKLKTTKYSAFEYAKEQADKKVSIMTDAATAMGQTVAADIPASDTPETLKRLKEIIQQADKRMSSADCKLTGIGEAYGIIDQLTKQLAEIEQDYKALEEQSRQQQEKLIDYDMACGALDAIRDLLDSGGIPHGTYPDDQVRNLVAMYNQQQAMLERAEESLCAVLDSDMAMREEDEGGTSPTLDRVRKTLAALKAESQPVVAGESQVKGEADGK